MTADAPGPEARPPASLLGVPIRRPGPARQRRADAAPAPASGPRAASEPAVEDQPPADQRTASDPGALDLVAADTERAPEPATAAPADAAAAQEPPPPSRPEAPAQRHFRDLRHYWRAVARGGIAEVDALDGALIARHWPYSLVVRVPDDGLLDIERVFQPPEDGTGDGGVRAHPLSGDRLSQLSSWVLGLAREAARARRPQEARDSFQLAGRRRSYKAQLLPCARSGDPAAYVLLGLSEE